MSLKSIIDEYTLSQRRLLDNTEKVYSRLVDALKTITDERDTLLPLSGVLKDARRINDDLRAQLSVSQKAVTTLNSELMATNETLRVAQSEVLATKEALRVAQSEVLATKEALRVAQRAVAREAARAEETKWCVCDGRGQFTKRRWINDKMMQEVTETCPAESHFETVGGCVVGNSASVRSKATQGCTDCGTDKVKNCKCPYAPVVDSESVYAYVQKKGEATQEELGREFGYINAKKAIGMCLRKGDLVLENGVLKTKKGPTDNYWSRFPTAVGGGSTGPSGLHVPEPSKTPAPPAPAPAQVAHIGGSLMDQVLKAAANPPPPVTDDDVDDILKQATDGSKVPFDPYAKDRLVAKEFTKAFLDLLEGKESECKVQ